MTTTTQIVVVGYGLAGRKFHAPLIVNASGVELVGVVARRAEVRQQVQDDFEGQVASFATLSATLAIDCDAIVIATPPQTHFALAREALMGGRHVVIDKPACTSLSDFDALVDLARKLNLKFTVFHNRRLDTGFLTVQNLISSNSLGAVRHFEMNWNSALSSRQWKQAPIDAAGGRFWDLAVHMVDQLLALFPTDSIRAVSALVRFDFVDKAPNTDSHVELRLTLKSGLTARIVTSSINTIVEPRFLVVGSKATFKKFGKDPQEQALADGDVNTAVLDAKNFGTLQTTTDSSSAEETVTGIPGDWTRFYMNFGEFMRGQTDPIVDLATVRRVLHIMIGVSQAAAKAKLENPTQTVFQVEINA